MMVQESSNCFSIPVITNISLGLSDWPVYNKSHYLKLGASREW